MTSSKSKKKYKALILDVDGTIINGRDSLPSAKVTLAVNEARDLIHIGVATSRPLFVLDHIIAHLKLSGPSIVNAGANVVDSVSGKVLWQRPVLKKDLKKIQTIARSLGCKLEFTGHKEYSGLITYLKEDILQVWSPNLYSNLADKF